MKWTRVTTKLNGLQTAHAAHRWILHPIYTDWRYNFYSSFQFSRPTYNIVFERWYGNHQLFFYFTLSHFFKYIFYLPKRLGDAHVVEKIIWFPGKLTDGIFGSKIYDTLERFALFPQWQLSHLVEIHEIYKTLIYIERIFFWIQVMDIRMCIFASSNFFWVMSEKVGL